MNVAQRAAETGTANPLKQLERYGQSPWLDFIRRGFIADGSLHRLIVEDALKGVTGGATDAAAGAAKAAEDAAKGATDAAKDAAKSLKKLFK